MHYESKIKELKEKTEILQNPELSMVKALEVYESASKIYMECYEYLEKAKGGIYKIKRELETFKEERID